MLSAHAEVFGVGITVVVGSRLLATSCDMSGWIVPGDGLVGICGVESGKAAPFVGGPPGVELHTVVDELPSGVIGEMVPVVLPTIDVGMVPNGTVDGVIAIVLVVVDVEIVLGTVDNVGMIGTVMEVSGKGGSGGGCGAGMAAPKKSVMNDVAGCADSVKYGVVVAPIVGAVVLPGVDMEDAAGTADIVGAAEIDGVAEVDGVVAIVPGIADREVTGGARVPGVICPVGAEQLTTVPGVVGSEASGTGASVVPGVPGCVVAENGLGP